MNNSLRLAVGFAIASLLPSCSTPSEPEAAPATPAVEEVAVERENETVKRPKKLQVWKPTKEETSELAQLMRDLHANGMERRAALAKGEMDTHYLDNVVTMLTATPTEAHMKGEGFTPHAQGFIAHYHEITQATTVEDQKQAHNAMVDACISCHSQFCQGPIPKIEKLYLK